MDKSKKITIGLYALSIFLILGISYAYFSLNIMGNEDAKLSVISAGTLELTYSDTNEITLNNAVPGDSFQKEISVKNTGTLDAMYNIIWQELTNEFIRNEIVISATCERLNSEGVVDGTCNNIEEKPVGRLSIPQKISIEPNITHKYTVTVKFIDTGKNQNYNQGKNFNGKLGIEEYIDNTPEATYCTFDGELTQGVEYINGQYTYRYKQHRVTDGMDAPTWYELEEDGWGMILTDATSTVPVTTTPCTYINDKPVVSISTAYSLSEATSIDLSKLNTSNVKYMIFTFGGTKATELDLSEFNTSNAITMYGMFTASEAKKIDLSGFDTSKVIENGMLYMFYNSKATTLDLSSFDTSKITDMTYMFYSSQATNIDLSSFDTSNVTSMEFMFRECSATTLDLTSFDTSNVTNMNNMFTDSKATMIDLSSFDVSAETRVESIFKNATNLKTIYASLNFNAAECNNKKMFEGCTSLVGGAGTTYDANNIGWKYAHIDGGTGKPGYFTSKVKISYDSIIIPEVFC